MITVGYVISYGAKADGRVSFNATFMATNKEDEAVGFGVRLSRQQYPIELGWRDHTAIANRLDLSTEYINELATGTKE